MFPRPKPPACGMCQREMVRVSVGAAFAYTCEVSCDAPAPDLILTNIDRWLGRGRQGGSR